MSQWKITQPQKPYADDFCYIFFFDIEYESKIYHMKRYVEYDESIETSDSTWEDEQHNAIAPPDWSDDDTFIEEIDTLLIISNC